MSVEIVKVGNLSVKVIEAGDTDAIQKELTPSDIEMDRRGTAAVNAAIERAKICKKPIARYDAETKRAYLEYADGRREYAN